MVLAGQPAISSVVGLGHQALHKVERPPTKGTMPCCQVTGPPAPLAAKRVTVADLPPAVAIGQMRGIVAAKGYDIMADEAEYGSMLIEQARQQETTLLARWSPGEALAICRPAPSRPHPHVVR